VNPNGGTVNLDGATLAAGAGAAAINLLAGTVNVTNDSFLTGTINSSATMGIASGKTLNISGGTLYVMNGGSIGSIPGSLTGPGNVNIVGSGLNLQNANTLFASNFSMGPTATLQAGANTLNLTGNFSFQQTDKTNAWYTNGTTGLGPNLSMNGTGVQQLEVGGIVKVDPMTNNFALNSLTIGAGSTVQLVDQYQNATPSGWTSGSEVLYLGALFDGPGVATLDLNGITCFVMDGTGFDQLYIGEIYNGVQIVPIPPSAMLLGTGLLGLAGLGWRRKKLSQA
jgi:hypothetical protein